MRHKSPRFDKSPRYGLRLRPPGYGPRATAPGLRPPGYGPRATAPGPPAPGPARRSGGLRATFKRTTECIFDRIAQGLLPAHLVLDEPLLVAFLDHRPLFPGHTLVVPRAHYATLDDLPDSLTGPLFEAARRIAAAQRLALGAQGNFLALNDRVSQSVPHVHLHVVPRTKGDGLRGFFWPRSRYGDDAQAGAVAASIRSALNLPTG